MASHGERRPETSNLPESQVRQRPTCHRRSIYCDGQERNQTKGGSTKFNCMTAMILVGALAVVPFRSAASIARGINDQGQVVGQSIGSGGRRAFLGDPAKNAMTTLNLA